VSIDRVQAKVPPNKSVKLARSQSKQSCILQLNDDTSSFALSRRAAYL
jgi:hypothetical protein